MMNQDQYHASLLNKGQPIGLGWDGITKSTQPKAYPAEPPNLTDIDKTIRQVQEDDHTLTDLNWNNIKVNICCSVVLTISFAFAKLFHSPGNFVSLFYFVMQNISEEKFETLFQALPENTHLEVLSLTNTGLTDRVTLKLAEALERNNTLRVLK